ncbi:sialic acid-binding Ig-like lectin 14 [Heteronotia binoei]|uniref:sialic acid-binding Ig-like lectin 14 n=1 Tax=Heteronotia binoei TaxID=13085 RepID=UPI0029301D18|nr:sialic acid-binding Ig-like lectin 14 [Heteronotia binoei]
MLRCHGTQVTQHRDLPVNDEFLAAAARLIIMGVRCDNSGYSLNVSSPVTVQDGLCITIPCAFTYDASHDDPHAPLYGYWFAEKHQEKHLVATNNPGRVKKISPQDRLRFKMSKLRLKWGDCSLSIHPSEATDNNTFYFFRMEKGDRARYDYNQEGRTVSLIVTERKPDITVSEPLRAGQEASIVCSAQWCASSGRPTVTWIGFSKDSTNISVPNMMDSRVERRVDFIPSAAGHRRNVTCKATYNSGDSRVSVARTIALNVSYAPRTFQFSGHLTLSNGSQLELTTYTQIVAQEGDSLLVRCNADGNPAGAETWVKKPQLSTAQLPTSNNTLQFLDLKLQDKGEYTCRAENGEGSAKEVFFLQIKRKRVMNGVLREGSFWELPVSVQNQSTLECLMAKREEC